MVSTLAWENEEYYPSSSNYQCPPLGAVMYSGDIYRFLKNDNVTDSEFELSSSKENFRNTYKNNYNVLCQGSGHSIYINLQDAIYNGEEMRKKSKGFKKKFKYIGKINLTTADGVIKGTPSSNTRNHHTWWRPISIQNFNNTNIIHTF